MNRKKYVHVYEITIKIQSRKQKGQQKIVYKNEYLENLKNKIAIALYFVSERYRYAIQ